jgi:ABC-type multidrug transport system fused ATPase/permease subunit
MQLLLLQIFISLLDLAGVLMLGLVVYIAASNGEFPRRISQWLDSIGLEVEGASQAWILGFALAAGSLLLLRSLASVALVAANTRNLGQAQARFSAEELTNNLRGTLPVLDKRSSQELAHAYTQASYVAITLVLGSWSIVVSEAALLIVLAAALLISAPGTALLSILYFGVIAVGLQRYLGAKASRAGEARRTGTVGALVRIQETLGAYREVYVSGRLPLVLNAAGASLATAAMGAAKEQFLVQMPKMLLEAALVLAGVVVVGWQLSQNGFADAVALLAIFMAAAMRMLPSLLRMSGSLVLLRSLGEQASPAYALKVTDPTNALSQAGEFQGSSLRRQEDSGCNFEPSVHVEELTFTYPGSATEALSCVSLSIEPGERVAITGPSGSGKSTLADIILGVLQPSDGLVLIGGQEPADAIRLWKGSVAYVPQRSVLFAASIRENILPGIGDGTEQDEEIWTALSKAQLGGFVAQLPAGLDAIVGEHGKSFSGGQSQRLGLARALVTKPALLLLDEATSALDPEMDQALALTLDTLPETTTIITIAHRETALERAHRVIRLENGRLSYDRRI